VSEAVALADRIVLIEEGRIAMDERVALARPRERGAAGFARLEAKVLQRVMRQAPQAQGQVPSHAGAHAEPGATTAQLNVSWAT
jgi:sulfonate transport system ATP-binding protein